MKIVSLALPRPIGGGNTELGATLLLFRRMGWDVTAYSMSPEPPDNPWPDRLRGAGCTVVMDPMAAANLKDALCISLCCQKAALLWPKLKGQGCRLIWSPCMSTALHYEREVFRTCPPTAVHFQSVFASERRLPDFLLWGCKTHILIPGAFDFDSFPFRPKLHNGHFTVGYLARACRTKWPNNLWEILSKAKSASRVNLRFMGQGWNEDLEHRIGAPPRWADMHPEGWMESADFLSRCHCLFAACHHDVENWPRIGLEAMATGVPVVADDSGGWPDMLNGAGLLVGSEAEAVEAIRKLATNDVFRLDMADRARARVERITNLTWLASEWESAMHGFET